MCTFISQQVSLSGSGKGQSGWFEVDQASVSYDHPFNVALEYALNIDFFGKVNGSSQAAGSGERVAVELDVSSARRLVEVIEEVLKRAEAGGYVERST